MRALQHPRGLEPREVAEEDLRRIAAPDPLQGGIFWLEVFPGQMVPLFRIVSGHFARQWQELLGCDPTDEKFQVLFHVPPSFSSARTAGAWSNGVGLPSPPDVPQPK